MDSDESLEAIFTAAQQRKALDHAERQRIIEEETEYRRLEQQRREERLQLDRQEHLASMSSLRRWVVTRPRQAALLGALVLSLTVVGLVFVGSQVTGDIAESARIERLNATLARDAELRLVSTFDSLDKLVSTLEPSGIRCDQYRLAALGADAGAAGFSIPCYMPARGMLEIRLFNDPLMVRTQVCSSWGRSQFGDRALVVGGNWYVASPDWDRGASSAPVSPEMIASLATATVTSASDYCL